MCISRCAASVAAGGCEKQYTFHKRGTNLWEGRFFTRSLAERLSGSDHRTSSRCRRIQPLRSKMIGSYFDRKNGHGKKVATYTLMVVNMTQIQSSYCIGSLRIGQAGKTDGDFFVSHYHGMGQNR